MSDLLPRIKSAIARVKASRAAAEVLAEIERDKVILDKARWERVLAVVRFYREAMTCDNGSFSANAKCYADNIAHAETALQFIHPSDLEPIRHDAAPDTSETMT